MTEPHPIPQSVPDKVLVATGSSGYKRRYHIPSADDGETPECVDRGETTPLHDTTYRARPRNDMIGTYCACTRCFTELAEDVEQTYQMKPCPKCGDEYKSTGMANHMRDCLAEVEAIADD